MDIKVGPNEETVNYDAKHLSRGTLIGENLNMGEGRTLMKSNLVKILEHAPNNSPYSIQSLVNPKDKQSVPLATQLLLLFSEAVADTDKLKQCHSGWQISQMNFICSGMLLMVYYVFILISKQASRNSWRKFH